MKNENDVWMKIKKEITGEKKDIYIVTVYLSPYKSKNENVNKISNLFEEILVFKGKGEVIIQGDFNARTNIDDDIIKPDKFDDILILPELNIPCRNSEDKVSSDQRGKELVELCKSLNLVILNGRKTGDLFGKCSSFQWNGASVVDYVLTSPSKFNQVEFFKVDDFIPWVSDHCVLHYRLVFEETSINEKPEKERILGEVYQTSYWDQNSTKHFRHKVCKDARRD